MQTVALTFFFFFFFLSQYICFYGAIDVESSTAHFNLIAENGIMGKHSSTYFTQISKDIFKCLNKWTHDSRAYKSKQTEYETVT